MSPEALEQIMLVVLFTVGLLLYLDSPTGVPRGTEPCGVRGCCWHPTVVGMGHAEHLDETGSEGVMSNTHCVGSTNITNKGESQ